MNADFYELHDAEFELLLKGEIWNDDCTDNR